MFIAFSLEAVGIWLLSRFGGDPLTFVILSGPVFFAWGEIYSLFPSTCTDAFGTKYATTNAGLLYTAKGTAALLAGCGKSRLRDEDIQDIWHYTEYGTNHCVRKANAGFFRSLLGGSAKAVKSDGHGMRVIAQSPDPLARMHTMTEKKRAGARRRDA